MLDSKQLSNLLGISQSALRRYIKVFPEAFTDEAKRKRGRRYSQQDVAAAGKIREMFQLGFREEEVRKAVGKVIIDADQEQQASTALEVVIPRFHQSINEIKQGQEKTGEWITETEGWKQDTGSRVARIETLLMLLFVAVVIFIVIVLVVR